MLAQGCEGKVAFTYLVFLQVLDDTRELSLSSHGDRDVADRFPEARLHFARSSEDRDEEQDEEGCRARRAVAEQRGSQGQTYPDLSWRRRGCSGETMSHE